MKAKTKSTKEVSFFVALALGLVLLAGLSRQGARPAAARPAFQEDTSILAPMMIITETLTSETPSPTPTLEPTPTPTMTFTPTPTPEMPVLTIIKKRDDKLVYDADGDEMPDPGDRLRYVITYGNTGNVVATAVIIGDDYDENRVSVDKISDNGKDWGDYIEWTLDDLPPDVNKQVTYEVTIKANLSPGSYELKNYAWIYFYCMDFLCWEEAQPLSVQVVVHPPTPTSTSTSTPAPTSTPMPSGGPQSGIFTKDPLIIIIVVSIVSFLAMAALFFGPILMSTSNLKPVEYKDGLELLRHGIFLVFLVFAVLILALGGGVESDGAISLLSAIVGYIFGRVTGSGSGTGTQASAPTPPTS